MITQINIALFLTALFVALLFPQTSFAHPGRTDASGGHTCRTNCSSWGLGDGEYHTHGSGGSSSGGSSTDSYTAPVQETVQTQEVVLIPTNTPIPTRVPIKIPTRVPTKTLMPTVTLTILPTMSITPTNEPTKKLTPLQLETKSVKAQKPEGFLSWFFSLFGFR